MKRNCLPPDFPNDTDLSASVYAAVQDTGPADISTICNYVANDLNLSDDTICICDYQGNQLRKYVRQKCYELRDAGVMHKNRWGEWESL